MNNIKLSIFTGKEDTDIIDLGLYNPSISGLLNLAYPISAASFVDGIEDTPAFAVSEQLDSMLTDMNTNPDKYKVFHVADLLAAQNYLNQLKVACDTYPACTVKIETI